MIHRRSPATDAELEQALATVAPQVVFPATPDIAGTIGSRLAVREQSSPRWRSYLPSGGLLRVVATLAVLVMAVVLLLVLSPKARTAVADRLGLRGVDISYVPPLDAAFAPPEVSASSTAPARFSARDLRLGRPVTLAEAKTVVPYSVLTPSLPSLRQPDAVYIGGPDGAQITFVYVAESDPRPVVDAEIALLITQFVGKVMDDGTALFGKGVPPNVQLEGVMVSGGRAYWIQGEPHTYFYRDSQGRIVSDSLRLAGNTLLWQQGELTARLEGARTKQEALEIAGSMR